MHEEGMSRRPSSGVTAPREIALYEGQQRALAEIASAMDALVRWIVLVGPDGSGKSVILQTLRAELRTTAADVVLCDGLASVEPDDLLMSLRGQLVLPAPGSSMRARRRRADLIVASRSARTNPLVILVDNAHGLSYKSLKLLAEVVRKTNPDSGWVCVVLAGRPSLGRPALRARGRLKYLHCSPEPLTASEVALQVEARLHAGPDRSIRILPDAVEEIGVVTGGWPGRIDALCELALRRPSVRLTREVTVSVVKEVADRLGLDPASDASSGRREGRGERWLRRVAIFLAILVPVGVGALGFTYGLPLVQAGMDWVAAQLADPEPVRPPATAPPNQAQAKAPRRAPAAPTASARTASAATGGDTRAGTSVESRGSTGAESRGRTGAESRGSAGAESRGSTGAESRVGTGVVNRVGPEPVARSRPGPPPPSREQVAAFLEGARAGRTDDIARLLDAGVSTEVRDASGTTALMHAVQQGHLDAARVLLDKGAQVNARDRGGITAAMLAVINERPDALDVLLRRGADVNARSGSGWTALTFAAWKGNPDLVRRLLQQGASRNVVDKQGWTPLDYASAHAQLSPGPTASDVAAQSSPSARHSDVVPLLQGAERP